MDCTLAFGFAEMQPGVLGFHWDDRESPFDNFLQVLAAPVMYMDYPARLMCCPPTCGSGLYSARGQVGL